jgi:hypothetical protein
MEEQQRTLWQNKTLRVALLIVIASGAIFFGGWWFRGRHVRTVSTVVDAYTTVYAGTDSTKDVVDLMPLYAADGVLRDMAADRTYQGTVAIKAALNALFATQSLDLTIDASSVGDDWAIIRWTADGTSVGTGRLAQASGITVLEIEKGMIVNETWYYDPAKAPF